MRQVLVPVFPWVGLLGLVALSWLVWVVDWLVGRLVGWSNGQPNHQPSNAGHSTNQLPTNPQLLRTATRIAQGPVPDRAGPSLTTAGRFQTTVGRLLTTVGRFQTTVGRLLATVGRFQTTVGRLLTTVGRPTNSQPTPNQPPTKFTACSCFFLGSFHASSTCSCGPVGWSVGLGWTWLGLLVG